MKATWYDLTTRSVMSTIDVTERVIAYGDGFFTTMAVKNGEIDWQDYHLKRVVTSCQALQMDIDIHLIIPALTDCARRLQQGMLKLIICRKNQPVRGYGFVDGQINAWLMRMPMALTGVSTQFGIMQQPAIDATCLNQPIACLPSPIAGLKLLNAQDKVLVSHELTIKQRDNALIGEGLVKDMLGHWVEGTISNVFYQLNHALQWYTPPIHHSGVKGVMRQVLLDKLPIMGEATNERVLEDEDLTQLTGLFFCNAVRGVMPVRQLYLPDGSLLVLDAPKLFAKRP